MASWSMLRVCLPKSGSERQHQAVRPREGEKIVSKCFAAERGPFKET